MFGGNNELKRTGSNGRRSVCISYNGQVWVSGLTTVDLAANTREQAKDIFEQIDRLLAANNSDKHHILMADIVLADINDYSDFNAEWDLWVNDGQEPCRNVVGGELALPEYRVKISVVAAEIK